MRDCNSRMFKEYGGLQHFYNFGLTHQKKHFIEINVSLTLEEIPCPLDSFTEITNTHNFDRVFFFAALINNHSFFVNVAKILLIPYYVISYFVWIIQVYLNFFSIRNFRFISRSPSLWKINTSYTKRKELLRERRLPSRCRLSKLAFHFKCGRRVKKLPCIYFCIAKRRFLLDMCLSFYAFWKFRDV